MTLIDIEPIKNLKWDRKNSDTHFMNGIDTMMEIINNQTPVDAKPIVYAHWIPNDYMIKSPTAKNYKCSNCNIESFKYDFCPNCGATMIEGSVDDETD